MIVRVLATLLLILSSVNSYAVSDVSTQVQLLEVSIRSLILVGLGAMLGISLSTIAVLLSMKFLKWLKQVA